MNRLTLIVLLTILNFSCSENPKGLAKVDNSQKNTILTSDSTFLNNIIQKENKKKLIVSDFKIQPVLKGTIEEDSFIIISNADILKSHVQNYLNSTKLLTSKDSSYIEFEIISTKNDKLKGFLSLIRDKSGQEDSITFGTEIIDKKILK